MAVVSHPVTSVIDTPASHLRFQVCLCTRGNVIVKPGNLWSPITRVQPAYRVCCVLYKENWFCVAQSSYECHRRPARAGSHSIVNNKRWHWQRIKCVFHQQPFIYTLRLLACHSISHSVDYTLRGARGENHTGNPILCHIKCQGRSFRFSVITTETAERRSWGRALWR